MSLVSKEKLADATWKVEACVSAEDFCAALEKVFAKELPRMTLPGFRKGKAPRAMVLRRYGEKLFFDDALEAALPAAIEAALQEAELTPLYRPENLEAQEISRETGAVFSFTITVKPEVTIEGYLALEVAVPSEDVSEEDVRARIDELRGRNARQVEAQGRPARDGDIAVIDFKGLLEGEPFAGGTAENQELVLGSGQFIPGFEEQIIGRSPGEEFEVHVTFPEEYHAEDLAGKAVVFEVVLHELKTEELPALDDDFAQEVGEDYETVEDLQKGIAAELAENRREAAKKALEDGVRDQLAARLEGEIPQAMFDRRTQRNLEIFTDRIRVPMERYCELMGEDMEHLTARIAEQSRAQVKTELALEAIAALEGIEAGQEEIEAEYQRLADEYEVNLARAKFSVPAEEITKDVQREKAMALVLEAAVKANEK